MAGRKGKTPPGDIRLDPLDVMETDQPLDARGKALRKRAYELYAAFRDKLRPVHEQMRQARRMRRLAQDDRSATAPASMTLNSCVDNVIADQIDNTPEAVLVPEREETAGTAEEMSDVVGFVLYQAGWPGKYQRIMEDAVVTGTGIAQILWDEDMMDGEGMVNVIAWHPEDFYPDPMYEDIQDGRAVFKATQTTVAWVKEHYPEAGEYVQGDSIRPEEMPDMLEAAIGDEKVTLLEYWYKRYDAKARRYRVHMAQLAGQALLYSTELGIGCSEAEFRQGVYAHGQYPFLLYRYREVFRKPFGTGLIHDYKDTQGMIDRCLKYSDDNARMSSIQRYFVRKGGGVNIEDFADLSKLVIEYAGGDIRQDIQVFQANPLNGQVYQTMNFLIDAMKQDSGQNQFTRGEGGMGVTAASAISQLVAQGGKITRWHAEQFKDSFREMVEQILWVLSEYMTPDRRLMIVGGNDTGMTMEGRAITVNAPVYEGDALKKPAYSVRVQAQKHNPIWSERFNDLLLRAAEISSQTGRPIPADVLVSALQGFPEKGKIVRVLQETGTMYDTIEQLNAQIEQLQKQLEGAKAVARRDAQALGMPGIVRSTQQSGQAAGTIDYAQMTAQDAQTGTQT